MLIPAIDPIDNELVKEPRLSDNWAVKILPVTKFPLTLNGTEIDAFSHSITGLTVQLIDKAELEPYIFSKFSAN